MSQTDSAGFLSDPEITEEQRALALRRLAYNLTAKPREQMPSGSPLASTESENYGRWASAEEARQIAGIREWFIQYGQTFRGAPE